MDLHDEFSDLSDDGSNSPDNLSEDDVGAAAAAAPTTSSKAGAGAGAGAAAAGAAAASAASSAAAAPSPFPTATSAAPPATDAFLSPLIKAYEDRIKDLEDKNRAHGAELATLRANTQQVVAENDALREQLENALDRLTKQVNESPATGLRGGGAMGLLDGETADELKEQLETSMKEVDILKDEVETLKQLAGNLKAAADEREAVATAAVKKLAVVEPRLKTAEGKLRSMSDKAARAETAAAAAAEEAAAAEAARAAAASKLRDSEEAVKELQAVAQASSDSTAERANIASARARELKERCDQLERELEVANDANRELNRKYTTASKDAQDMLQVMQEWERQVNKYEAREKEWDGARRSAREEMEQAFTHKAQAEAREVQARREIARLLEKRRVEVAEAAAHQSRMVEEVRSRLMAQIEARNAEIAELGKTCVHWQAQAERAARDRRSLEAELERVDEAAAQEQDQLHLRIETLTQAAVDADGRRDAAVRERDEARRVAEELHASMAVAHYGPAAAGGHPAAETIAF